MSIFLRQKIIAYCLKKQNKNTGFTLIELLVVIIIIGILSAVSLPNLIGQIGKARETEAKNQLGSLARSQQAYHFEKQVFADTLEKLTINGSFGSQYYNFPDPTTANANSDLVKHQAIAQDSTTFQIRDYATGVYYNSGSFQISLCQGKGISGVVDVANTVGGACTNGGIKLK